MTQMSGTFDTLNYQYDAMSRLVGMTDGNGATVAAATYDQNSQLTRITTTGNGTTLLDMQYVYTAGANNGRVAETIDGVTGDTQAYGYDALNRLVSVTSSLGNNESMTYDGFGNLTSMNGTGIGVNSATNQPCQADANGNSSGYTWDIENRMTSNDAVYDPWGRRVGTDTSPVIFYSLSGQRLTGPNNVNRYFGGKMIQSNGVAVATDRLGSVRGNGNGEKMVYTAYGTERGNPTTPDGREKFGTYFRDAVGLDYAQQRYYGDQGRFLSVDPAGLTAASPMNPGSWNRYGYALADPVNLSDPAGLDSCGPGWQTEAWLSGPCGDPCDPDYQSRFAPSPSPPDPACATGGDPAPDPPKLTCSFGGAQFGPPGWGTVQNGNYTAYGYYMPGNFNFTASGGTDGYIWSDVQTVTRSGTITYSNGVTLTIPSNPTTESLDNVSKTPTGAGASFFDSPGLATKTPSGLGIVSATVTWIFSLQVSVSSGGQTVKCDPVSWTASLTWKTVKGKPDASGSAKVMQ
jgi:RHS repeat-associated protein